MQPESDELGEQGSPDPRGKDRWERHDWWGVVLDAPDVALLTRFYSELRGWAIWRQDADDAALDLGEGVTYLSIQRNPDYVRPVWPASAGSQQMMMHLDFERPAQPHAVRGRRWRQPGRQCHVQRAVV